jgi:hypothetical protein
VHAGPLLTTRALPLLCDNSALRIAKDHRTREEGRLYAFATCRPLINYPQLANIQLTSPTIAETGEPCTLVMPLYQGATIRIVGA